MYLYTDSLYSSLLISHTSYYLYAANYPIPLLPPSLPPSLLPSSLPPSLPPPSPPPSPLPPLPPLPDSQPSQLTVTPSTKWSEVQDYLTTPTDKPVVLNRSSSTNSVNPFGSTYCYGFQNFIFEVWYHLQNSHTVNMCLKFQY